MTVRDILFSASGSSGGLGANYFSAYAYSGDSTNSRLIPTNINLSGSGGLVITKMRNTSFAAGCLWADTVQGANTSISSASASLPQTSDISFSTNGHIVSSITDSYWNTSTYQYISWSFKKAPTFFDVVSYTGTGSTRTVSHALTTIPELIIVKAYTNTTNWAVYHQSLGNTQWLRLNTAFTAATNATAWNNTSPTASVFTVGSDASVNSSSVNYITYLFSSVPGVCKIGTYSGIVSASQTIDCGFTAGARFVMIKRTDNAGDWYIWDSTRGIGAGNDPHLAVNLPDAEVTTDDSIAFASNGFTVNQVAATNINVSAASYVYLAIA